VAITQRTVAQIFGSPVIMRRFAYLVVLMTAFNWMAHGTQDVYPTIPERHRRRLRSRPVCGVMTGAKAPLGNDGSGGVGQNSGSIRARVVP